MEGDLSMFQWRQLCWSLSIQNCQDSCRDVKRVSQLCHVLISVTSMWLTLLYAYWQVSRFFRCIPLLKNYWRCLLLDIHHHCLYMLSFLTPWIRLPHWDSPSACRHWQIPKMTGWPVDIELETTGSSLPLLDINLAHKFNQRFNYLSTLIMWLKG